jgi:5S rRNA maturation endonuclease (ribonuclease M5)
MKYSLALVNQLTDECCENIEDCLVELGVNFFKSKKRIIGCCPIHNGDNPSAWNLYPCGEEVRGVWICRTHHCEKKWKKNFAGLIHGVLSNRVKRELHWTVAIEWMLKFLKYNDASEVKLPSKEELDKRAQAAALNKWNILPKSNPTIWTRDKVRRTLQIPSEYFMQRGYKSETLDKYDVGLYKQQNRILVPVYDPLYKFVVGFVGRSIFEKCDKCKYWHSPTTACPATTEEQINCAKWKNSKGFEAGHHLYNYWFARKSIIDTSAIILVEGPGDVWKLEEAGIHNAVAIFGTNFTEEQSVTLESSWCLNVILMLDNDNAGRVATEDIKKRLQRTHRLYFPTFAGKDVGELQTDKITADIAPLIEQIQNVNQKIGIKEK